MYSSQARYLVVLGLQERSFQLDVVGTERGDSTNSLRHDAQSNQTGIGDERESNQESQSDSTALHARAVQPGSNARLGRLQSLVRVSDRRSIFQGHVFRRRRTISSVQVLRVR